MIPVQDGAQPLLCQGFILRNIILSIHRKEQYMYESRHPRCLVHTPHHPPASSINGMELNPTYLVPFAQPRPQGMESERAGQRYRRGAEDDQGHR